MMETKLLRAPRIWTMFTGFLFQISLYLEGDGGGGVCVVGCHNKDCNKALDTLVDPWLNHGGIKHMVGHCHCQL